MPCNHFEKTLSLELWHGKQDSGIKTWAKAEADKDLEERGGSTCVICLGVCSMPLRTTTPLYSILWPIIYPILVHFGDEVTTFQPQTFPFFWSLLTRNFLHPKPRKCATPIPRIRALTTVTFLFILTVSTNSNFFFSLTSWSLTT